MNMAAQVRLNPTEDENTARTGYGRATSVYISRAAPPVPEESLGGI